MNGTFLKYNRGFRKLVVWQEAHKLTLEIYRLTSTFPKHEQFGMTSQLQRAMSSVGANISEGSSRKTRKEQRQFYYYAKSSLSEVDNFLELAHDLGYMTDEFYESLLEYLNKVAYLLCRLIDQ